MEIGYIDLQTFDKCDIFTKIICFVIVIFIFIIILSFISFMKSKKFDLMKILTKIVYIFKTYEFKTIAGMINMFLTTGLLFITVLTFIFKSIWDFALPSKETFWLKLILVLVTVISSFICIIFMLSFDKLKGQLAK